MHINVTFDQGTPAQEIERTLRALARTILPDAAPASPWLTVGTRGSLEHISTLTDPRTGRRAALRYGAATAQITVEGGSHDR